MRAPACVVALLASACVGFVTPAFARDTGGDTGSGGSWDPGHESLVVGVVDPAGSGDQQAAGTGGTARPFYWRYTPMTTEGLDVEGGLALGYAAREAGDIPPPTPYPPDAPAGAAPCGVSRGDVIVFGIINYAEEIQRSTGAVIGHKYICVPLHGAPSPPTAAAPTLAEIWKAVPVPHPNVLVSPRIAGLTGMETWFWYDQPTEVQVNVTLDGWMVTGTARLTRLEWDTGDHDGTLHVAGTYDTPVQTSTEHDHAARHVYETKGRYVLSTTAEWTGRVHLTGPAGEDTDEGIGTLRLVPTTRDYDVLEVRSQLIPSQSTG